MRERDGCRERDGWRKGESERESVMRWREAPRNGSRETRTPKRPMSPHIHTNRDRDGLGSRDDLLGDGAHHVEDPGAVLPDVRTQLQLGACEEVAAGLDTPGTEPLGWGREVARGCGCGKGGDRWGARRERACEKRVKRGREWPRH